MIDELNDIERDIEYGPQRRYWQCRADIEKTGEPRKVWEVDYMDWPWHYRHEGYIPYQGGWAWLGVISDVSAQDARSTFDTLLDALRAERYQMCGGSAAR